MPKQIRDLSCSVSSFKYQLDKYLSTIPDTPCIANYDNSLENCSHTNPHLLTGVHPVWPDTLIKGQTTTSITSITSKTVFSNFVYVENSYQYYVTWLLVETRVRIELNAFVYSN